MKKKTEKTEKTVTEITVVLPEEVQALAVQVPEDKQKIINEVLSVTFGKITTLETEINDISVTNITDTDAMKLAKEKRIAVKNARLEASKLLDLKRQEVQQEMADYQLQDKLLLKAKQVMEIKCKAIEEAAEYKEKFTERYIAEQKLKRDLERLDKARKFRPDITIEEVEAFSDELYNFFLDSLKKEYEAEQERIKKANEEAIKEQERQRLHRERLSSIKQYSQFFDVDSFFGDMSQNQFASVVNDLRTQKEKYDHEQAEIKKRAEEAEKARIEAQKKERIEREKRKAIEKELKDKKAAEQKALADAENARKEKELMERLAAEKETKRLRDLAKAPVKEQLNKWVDDMTIVIPQNLTENEMAKLIFGTFNKFKNWAKKEINIL